MGSGFSYKCKKCKEKYSVHLGVGMLFPRVYQNLLNNIKNGEYGDELKLIADSQQYVAINASRWVYICSHCGKWNLEYAMDLYAPVNIKEISGKKFGDKTVSELGYVPYVTPYSLHKDYKLLKRFIHKCPDCGKRTHRANEKEFRELSCPHCKNKNNKVAEIMWD